MDYLNQLGNQNIQTQGQQPAWQPNTNFAANRYMQLSDFTSSQPSVQYPPSGSDSVSFSSAAIQDVTPQDGVTQTQQADTKQLERQRTIDFINDYLKNHKSPAAEGNAGEMMVKYGEQYNVDPKVLLSIAGSETSYGTKGLGLKGMMGVGAFDDNPQNAVTNPKFSGMENQIKVGAQTFDKLRTQYGISSDAPISDQINAVNSTKDKDGAKKQVWATATGWSSLVNSVYKGVINAENKYDKQHPIEQAAQ